MTKRGPIKHCYRCNNLMMKQVMKCSHCGMDQSVKGVRRVVDANLKAILLGSAAALSLTGAR